MIFQSFNVPRFHVLLVVVFAFIACRESKTDFKGQKKAYNLEEVPWRASWIAAEEPQDSINTMTVFRKTFMLEDEVKDVSTLRIAVDSKYWLYLNGHLVVFEGGLKRGPTPEDTYYDEIDLSGMLKQGSNTLAVLLWYFGKDGMAHHSSGKAGLLAELYQGKGLILQSDTSWKALPHPAYIPISEGPQPNWRLAESNLMFDARKDIPGWINPGFDDGRWPAAKVLAQGINAPWNQLVKRPIPFWKDYGLSAYGNTMTFPFVSQGDTISCKLPHNGHFTPYMRIKAEGGEKIGILTDNYKGGSEYNVRAEYIAKKGEQSYESLGWMNGHTMYYVIPEGVEVLDLKYRETGYDTEFVGNIELEHDFYNELCKKAVRTLYVTMRDNYMDCPDRERAQWWGDVVLESGEAFYALDRSSDLLMRKGMLELMHWQRPDSTIFSPVPTGVWDKELPGQMLMSVGEYGFWNYYLHTGDLETIRQIHQPVKRYLSLWKTGEDGTLRVRKGGWTWGDWGTHKDVPLLMNTQYYLALKGYQKMSEALGSMQEADSTKILMGRFKRAFNQQFWKEDHYRSPAYQGQTDDRSQGLAVVAGLADPEKYQDLYKVLQKEQHASPYMEKYVLEALFQMGYPDYALERMKERFSKMVQDTTYSTLWEGWGIGAEGFGGGTTNHAWSGGGLTLLYQYVAGIAPTAPGWKTFRIRPQLGFLKKVSATVPSIRGNISMDLDVRNGLSIVLSIPTQTEALVYIPKMYSNFKVNGEVFPHTQEGEYHSLRLRPGTYEINTAD